VELMLLVAERGGDIMQRMLPRFALLALSFAGSTALGRAGDGHKLWRLSQDCAT